MIFGRRPAVAKAVAGRPTQSRTGVWRIFLFSLKGTKFPVLKRQRSFCLLPSHTDRVFMQNNLTIPHSDSIPTGIFLLIIVMTRAVHFQY
jgi:hypothetical protein